MCLLSVVEMKLHRVIYETTEGEGSLRVCAFMESVIADIGCLVNFTVYAYINTTDRTTGMYSIHVVCSSISIDILGILYSCGFS